MITTALIYDHRKRGTAQDERPLEVRVTVDGRSYYINTGIKIRRSEWKDGTIVNRPDSDALNTRVRTIYNKIEIEVNEVLKNGEAIDVADIKRRAWTVQADESSTSMLDWISEQIDALSHREGTLKHYRTMLLRLQDFGLMRKWNDLTVENIYKWDAWLHRNLKNQKNEMISDGAVYNYHKCLKAILNRAKLFDRIKDNPYDRLRGKFKRGDSERIDFLTDEEVSAIESLHPVAGSKMEKVRDFFVFQMWTGLSYSDALNFSITDYKLIDGVYKHTGERIKTGVSYVSQLLPPVVEILSKYGWKVPDVGQNGVYNAMLKDIGSACGIDRPLHSHMARHTFATWMLRHGIPIEHVSRMLGHTNITQTQHYAKVVASDIHDDYERISKMFETKK